MDNNVYIGIDLGTSGCRVIAIDSSEHIVAQAQQSLTLTPYHFEQDPHQHWQLVRQVLSEVIAQCCDYHIHSIAVDATSGSILLVDMQGTPLSPLLMYNDNRAIIESTYISEIAPKESGCHGASSGLAKLLYLQKTLDLPKHYYLLHQADWISLQLGVDLGITDENNALKSGYDPIQQQWPAWLKSIQDIAILPKVVSAGSEIGELSLSLCKDFNLSYSPKLTAGTTDSIAAFIATGASDYGDGVTSLGSTLVVKIISKQPIFVPEQGIYSHRLADKWLVGGASNTGGAVLRHYFDDEQLKLLSNQISFNNMPESYYPLLSTGERFPINDPTLKAKLHPRPESDSLFLHGLLNSMASIEYDAYHVLHTAGASPLHSLRTVGGGAINHVWTQLRQQHIAVPFIKPHYTEAAYGTALLAKGIS